MSPQTPALGPTPGERPNASESRAVQAGTGKSRSPVFTCSRCDAAWTGTSLCHCSGCHRSFGGVEYRDGAWRGPAMTQDAIAARRAGGAA